MASSVILKYNATITQGNNFNLESLERAKKNLIAACKNGQIDQVKAFLADQPENVHICDSDKRSLLMLAARFGHVEVVNYLLELNCSVKATDSAGWTPLLWAAYGGFANIVSALLFYGADPNCREEKLITPLIWASGRGHLVTCRLLLDRGAQVDATDKFGNTALFWATFKNRADVGSLLLERGANVNVAGMHGWTPLMIVAKQSIDELVEPLLRTDVNLNATDKDGMSAAMYAAKEGCAFMLSALLERGADTLAINRSNENVLMMAVRSGSVDCVRMVLKRKRLDLDHMAQDRKTALWMAADKGYMRIVELLADHGCSLDIQCCQGTTALMQAVIRKHNEVAHLLIRYGASLAVSDWKGDTALHLVVRSRNRRLLDLMLRNPKDNRLLYTANHAGETPYSIDRSHEQMILNHIFGARRLNESEIEENLLGYDLYANALAGVLSDPNLVTPITVGLYAKWGSGKAFLIRKLADTLCKFCYSVRPPQFQVRHWSLLSVVICVPAFVFLVTAILLGFIYAATLTGTLVAPLVPLLILLHRGSRHNIRPLKMMADLIARRLQQLELFAKVVFLRPCRNPPTDQLRFLFTDYSRLVSVGGERSVARMVRHLAHSVEQEYGALVSRSFRVFRTPIVKSGDTRWKTTCGVPSLAVFLLWGALSAVSLLGWAIYREQWSEWGWAAAANGSALLPDDEDAPRPFHDGIFVTLLVFSALSLLLFLLALPKLLRLVVALCWPTTLRIRRLADNFDRDEGSATLGPTGREVFMQHLKSETRLMGDLARCLDSFQGTVTRLVIVVDCLDNCEQDKAFQMLDTVSLLFADNSHAITYGSSRLDGDPFITVLAMDPWIFVRGGLTPLKTAAMMQQQSAISGWQYLKNHVDLPLHLHAHGHQLQHLLRQWRPHTDAQRRVQAGGAMTKSDGLMARSRGLAAMDPDLVLERLADAAERDSIGPDAGDQPLLDDASRYHSVVSLAITHPAPALEPSPSVRRRQSVADRPSSGRVRTTHTMSGFDLHGSSLHSSRLDLTAVFSKGDYFSDVNPTSLRRLLNILALSGRLLRSYNLHFSWFRLAQWLNLVEQWPLRISWMLVYLFGGIDSYLQADNLETLARTTLYSIYQRIKHEVPDERDLEPHLLIDKNPRKLDASLASLQPALTVREVAEFMAATINLDPFLRKQCIELRQKFIAPVSVTPLNHPQQPNAFKKATVTKSSGSPPMGRLRTGISASTEFTTCAEEGPLSEGTFIRIDAPPAPRASYVSPSLAPLVDRIAPLIPPSVHLLDITCDDLCHLLRSLDMITTARHKDYCDVVREHNLNGLVLACCSLDELKPLMRMAFGDWLVFQALVLHLRNREHSASGGWSALGSGSAPRAERPERMERAERPERAAPLTAHRMTTSSHLVEPIDERDESRVSSSDLTGPPSDTGPPTDCPAHPPTDDHVAASRHPLTFWHQVALESDYIGNAVQQTFPVAPGDSPDEQTDDSNEFFVIDGTASAAPAEPQISTPRPDSPTPDSRPLDPPPHLILID